MRILHITDTHLSATHPLFLFNWRRMAQAIRDRAPDLVIHTGDAAISDPDRTEDIAFAKQEMDALGLPYLIVPGNHDVGDNPIEADWLSRQPKPCTDARRAAWRAVFGPDYFVHDHGPLTVLGINTQLFGTGLTAEAAQWALIEETLKGERPVLIAAHKPLYSQDDGADRALWSVPQEDSARLEAMMPGAVAYLSGHLHRQKVIERNGVPRVWGASTAFVCSHERFVRRGGRIQVGAVELTIDPLDNQGEAPAVTASFFTDLGCLNHDIWTWLEPGSPGLGAIMGEPFPVASPARAAAE
ncbi:MAG: metallophosphoesterase [Pseudomonadota bacterium]